MILYDPYSPWSFSLGRLIFEALRLLISDSPSEASELQVDVALEAADIKRRKEFEKLIREGRPAIALDFGTGNSQMAYCTEANAVPKLITVNGKHKIPTAIYYNEELHSTLIGNEAKNEIDYQLVKAENDISRIDSVFRNYMAFFKPIFCAKDTAYDEASPLFKENGTFFSWGEVVTEFFKFFKTQAEQAVFHGESVEGICITCPVAFPSKALYEEAAQQAGFTCVDFMEEPRAAYLGYMQDGVMLGDNVLVFDMGGGTLDIAFLQKDNATWKVTKTPMRIDAAGDHLDHHIMQDILLQVQASHSDLKHYNGDTQFLKYIREKVKEPLGARVVDCADIRYFFDRYEQFFKGSITQEHFDKLVMQCMEEKAVFTKLHEYIDSLGVPVDSILMVGGSSQLKCLQERMKQEFNGINVYAPHDGDSVVARGALTLLPMEN